MTEPQPSRSVKRPTQSLSKRARDWVRPCRQTRRTWACLKKPEGQVRELHQFLPPISDSSGNLCHFFAGWPIFGWNWRRRSKVLGKTGFRGETGLKHFPITWNPVIGKDTLKINKLGRVRIEKSLAVFSRPALGNPPLRGPVGSGHGLRGVFHVAFG